MSNEEQPDIDGPALLSRTLEKSRSVKARAESVAEDLASHNDDVQQEIARGATMVSAHRALAAGAKAEEEVEACAVDLDEVNGNLAAGIEDLHQINTALAGAKRMLARTNLALQAARESEDAARLHSMHDPATGLPNRELFDDRLEHAISLAKRHDWMLAIMFLDLDGFKRINDTHGHAVGDHVLKEVARRLLAHSRHEDTVCRNGGDEFLFLLVNPRKTSDVARIASELLKTIARPIDADGMSLIVTASIGISTYPDSADHADLLVRNADASMYRAKRGRTGLDFFQATDVHGKLF